MLDVTIAHYVILALAYLRTDTKTENIISNKFLEQVLNLFNPTLNNKTCQVNEYVSRVARQLEI